MGAFFGQSAKISFDTFGCKNTRWAWAGGTFFPVVLLCQFFGFWQEIGFGVNYLHI
jgi:hypothetical protein